MTGFIVPVFSSLQLQIIYLIQYLTESLLCDTCCQQQEIRSWLKSDLVSAHQPMMVERLVGNKVVKINKGGLNHHAAFTLFSLEMSHTDKWVCAINKLNV